MQTVIKRGDIKNNVALIKDFMSEFNVNLATPKLSWEQLRSTFNGGKLTNDAGGESWIEGNSLHVNLPYINLELQKVG